MWGAMPGLAPAAKVDGIIHPAVVVTAGVGGGDASRMFSATFVLRRSDEESGRGRADAHPRAPPR